MIIPNRSAYRDLLKRDTFGNGLRSWKSLDELAADPYQGPVTLRHQSGGAVFIRYYVAQETIEQAVKESGHPRKLLWANESAPDHRLVFQGEAMRGLRGWTLFVSDIKKPMHEALKVSKHVYGLRALMMLKGSFTESSYADFEALNEQFPDSVIEFSVYSSCLGKIPGRNVLIWEVRNY